MPIGTEIAFLRSILNDTGVANTDEKKVTLRSKKSVLYLQAWQRLLSEYDPLYVQRPFSFNVEPPPGAGGIPGMDPSWITDLKLRQEYEALIEENGNNMRANNRQRSLSDLNDTYPKQAEKYLIASYSTPPYNFEELRGLLDLYITDKAVKTRILDSVAKKMGLK